MPTNIPTGHPLARKIYSAAVFAEAQRRPGFRKNLTGPAPKQKGAEKKLKGQTSPGYPVVQVTDLSKGKGDQVSVDLFNIIQGKPVMGDKKISGKMMSLTASSQDIRIDQCRGGVDPGGRMTQKRTVHNLRSIAKANLAGWSARLEDQTTLVHLAGARGDDNAADWVVPKADDPDFSEIMVNPVQAPTRNRRFFAGDATSVATLSTADLLGLEEIDLLRAYIDEMPFPLQHVQMEGDLESDENPLFCLFVSSRVWHHLQTNTSATAWRTFLANAHARSQGFNHPLFKGTPGMWNGILIKKMWRPVRFNTGSLVKELDANDIEQDVAAAVVTDRSILLGAQALASVYGKHEKSGYHYSWHEEETDHGNTVETSIALMGGKSKLRFQDSDGNLTDHGVITMDSYAPVPVGAP